VLIFLISFFTQTNSQNITWDWKDFKMDGESCDNTTISGGSLIISSCSTKDPFMSTSDVGHMVLMVNFNFFDFLASNRRWRDFCQNNWIW
jgi:hypothetical protein